MLCGSNPPGGLRWPTNQRDQPRSAQPDRCWLGHDFKVKVDPNDYFTNGEDLTREKLSLGHWPEIRSERIVGSRNAKLKRFAGLHFKRKWILGKR